MQMASWRSRMFLAAIGFVALVTLVSAQTTTPNSVPAIPKGKETDVKFYSPRDGKPVIGGDALEQMSKADLILWFAGNQGRWLDLCRQGLLGPAGHLCVGQPRASKAAKGL